MCVCDHGSVVAGGAGWLPISRQCALYWAAVATHVAHPHPHH